MGVEFSEGRTKNSGLVRNDEVELKTGGKCDGWDMI